MYGLVPSHLKELYKLMYQLNPLAEYWAFDKEGTPYPCAPGQEERSDPTKIPSQFYLNQTHRLNDINYGKTKFKLAWVRAILSKRDLTDEELKFALKICADGLSLIQLIKDDGKTVWFEGNAKGTERYNKKAKGKIYDFVEYYQSIGYEAFFLTLTCDIKKYGDRAHAWLHFLEEEFYPVMENLRKHHNCKYVATLESTLNGYPHVHIILFFPKGTFPALEKYPNKKRIVRGKLYDYIKKNVNSKIFRLERAKGDNLKHYLTKYIGKGVEEDIFKIAEQEKPLTSSQKKLLKEFIYLKAFGKRKVLMSRIPTVKVDTISASKAEASVPLYKMPSDTHTLAMKSRAVLTSLCTNPPCSFKKRVSAMSFNQFSIVFGSNPERNNDVSQQNQKKFENNAQLLYDCENFIYDFIMFIQKRENSRLNRKFYWNYSEQIFSRLLDGYDLDTDEGFLDALAAIWDFYCTEILVNGNSYYNVLHGFENLSPIRIDEKLNKAYYKKVDKNDLRNCYYSNAELKEMWRMNRKKA